MRGWRNFVVLLGHLPARPRHAGVLRHGIGHHDPLVIEVASQHSVDVGDADTLILRDHVVGRRETLHGDGLTPLQSQAFDRVRIELELRNLAELGSLDEVRRDSGLLVAVDDTAQLAIRGRRWYAHRNGGIRNSKAYLGKGLRLKAGRQGLSRIRHASQIAACAREHVAQDLTGRIIGTVVTGKAIAQRDYGNRLIRLLVKNRGFKRSQMHGLARGKFS